VLNRKSTSINKIKFGCLLIKMVTVQNSEQMFDFLTKCYWPICLRKENLHWSIKLNLEVYQSKWYPFRTPKNVWFHIEMLLADFVSKGTSELINKIEFRDLSIKMTPFQNSKNVWSPIIFWLTDFASKGKSTSINNNQICRCLNENGFLSDLRNMFDFISFFLLVDFVNQVGPDRTTHNQA